MSAAARRKGHNFERTIVNKLKDELGVECKRVLDLVCAHVRSKKQNGGKQRIRDAVLL